MVYRSTNLSMRALRCSMGVVDQVVKAVWPARTASSTSCFVAQGTWGFC